MTRVLIAGESWVSESTHYKGYDAFTTVTFHTGVDPLRNALRAEGIDVDYIPAHEVPERFPATEADLAGVDVVILSDIGANSVLLHPDTWLHGKRTPNRLAMLAEWVRGGGGLMMAGGYLSFQGFEGKAMWRGTAVESVLPSLISPYDDRVETPEGIMPVAGVDHPVTAGLDGSWPALLGYNRFATTDDATVLARVGDDPLLAVRTVDAGRTLAWASDIAPHWCPEEFLGWHGYRSLFGQAVTWLAKGE
ncbi:glutamine amidotransferase [Phytoactinopolyspora mesophila]|uniref:Cytoplasmic protein n=1 Tax=Phytoactinopolyspora mesophila TaxID=2650750 RepID=A0A7K3M7E0_9ACTN|nr:glutamine amidotransferase [Phytoactinopolyspora mesophila]NDL59100.1 cytoplasmic protein [Phytoactinopolyspora mesophila]